MPRIKETTVYQFDELDDDAKERAREWYRQGALDYEWWDCTFDDAKTCLRFLGFEIDKIYFSGFASQGDGACFTGTWAASDINLGGLREHALEHPSNAALWELAKAAAPFVETAWSAALSGPRGHYVHEHSVEIRVDYDDEEMEEHPDDETDAVEELCRDAMRWVYRSLEREHDWLLADEQVDESIRINKYEFTEHGEPC